MRRLFALAIVMLSPLTMAPVASHYSTAHQADPADCGAECTTRDLDDFPYWDYAITALGNSVGAVGDGTYTWLGSKWTSAGLVGYIITSDHSGGVTADHSFQFSQGTYQGRKFRATGNDYNLADFASPHLIEVTTMEYSPSCAAVNDPDPCCDGYRLGDGTCADGESGGAIPYQLPWVRIGDVSDLNIGDPMITMGYGPIASSSLEWYFECGGPLVPGGGDHIPACCSYSGTRQIGGDPRPVAPGDLDSEDFIMGGIGADCDQNPIPMTYLGPVADYQTGILAWAYLTYNGTSLNPGDLRYFEDDGERVGSRCLVEFEFVLGTFSTSPSMAEHYITTDWLNERYFPDPRGAGMADCALVSLMSGDSGSLLFAKFPDDGLWRAVAIVKAAVFEPLTVYRAWLYDAIRGQ